MENYGYYKIFVQDYFPRGPMSPRPHLTHQSKKPGAVAATWTFPFQDNVQRISAVSQARTMRETLKEAGYPKAAFSLWEPSGEG